ncbi:MAG: hypothetical protein ABI576_21105 [Flavobacterium sp.]
MKKITIILGFLLLVLYSCQTYKRTKFEYHFGKNEDNKWVNMYKTKFFFDCLRKGYKDDTFFDSISKKDLLFPYEPILFEYGKIDTLATKVTTNMPKPIYPHCDDCTETEEKENLKKNYICASCLNYYASRELDSIAKEAYKKHLKEEKKQY